MLPPMNHIHQPRDQAAPMPRTTTVTGDQILMTLVLKDHEIINLKDRIAWLERQCEEFAQERDVAMRGNEAREAELQKWRDAGTIMDLAALGWKAKDTVPEIEVIGPRRFTRGQMVYEKDNPSVALKLLAWGRGSLEYLVSGPDGIHFGVKPDLLEPYGVADSHVP